MQKGWSWMGGYLRRLESLSMSDAVVDALCISKCELYEDDETGMDFHLQVYPSIHSDNGQYALESCVRARCFRRNFWRHDSNAVLMKRQKSLALIDHEPPLRQHYPPQQPH